MPRVHYSFRIDLEVPGPTLEIARERALRLFRSKVRDNLRMSMTYVGAYRGCWFAMSVLSEPPKNRVDLKTKKVKLTKKKHK